MAKRRILVVDDEESIRTLYQSALVTQGYEVSAAESGEKALEILETKLITIMFLDLNLPGMSGIQLCKKIMQKIPTAICIAVTGYASDFELADCKEAGFEDYFKKPMPLKELFNAAKAAFDKIDRWEKS
ncbi:MAG: response regulator [Desulfobacterales bacterium]|nr:response regulator [Desulfobacterales bacterium]